MSNLFKKIFVSFAVLSVVVWSSGIPALAAEFIDKEGEDGSQIVDAKVNICHKTGSSQNPWNALNVSSDGWSDGLDNHSVHESDYLYGGPVKENGHPENGDGLAETWCQDNAPAEISCGDGIINGDEQCDTGPNGSESCTVECTTIEQEPVVPSCEPGGIEIPVDLYVVGSSCDAGLPINDSEVVNLVNGGNYAVYTLAHRNALNEDPTYGQDHEEFTIRINSSVEGPIVLDQPDGMVWNIQNAGNFDFVSGDNTVYMDTAYDCVVAGDPLGRNSVEVKKLCLYKNESVEPYCGDGILNGEEECDAGSNGSDTCTAQCTEIEQPQEECSLEDSILVNSSFEDPIVTDSSLWQKMGSVFGWLIKKVSDNSNTTLELHKGWSGNVAADGWQYAELDGDESTRVTQNVTTEAGAQYKLYWSFAGRHDITAEQNQLAVEINGSQVATNGPVVGSAPLAQSDWVKSNYTFTADTTNTAISFKDNGPSNSFGTYLDDVRLCKIADPEPTPLAPWCSALLGVFKAYYDVDSSVYGIYNDVIDLNNDEVVNLSDLGLVTSMYFTADDDACYDRFDNGEGYNFNQDNYLNIDWCAGLKQGITDFYGTASSSPQFSTIFDLDDDGFIDLSDNGIFASLVLDNEEADQVACYAHYVPPMPGFCPVIAHAVIYENYPTCGAATCETGYHVSEGICVEDSNPPVCTPVAHAVSYNPYPGCGPATCETGYTLLEGSCVEQTACSTETLVEHATSYSAYPNCTATACESGYVLTGGACVAENRSSGGGGGGGYSAFNIFNVQNSLLGNSANITWQTNRQSLTWMLYGTSTSYGSEYQGANYRTAHTLELENLLPGTLYHYQVRAKDAGNNTVYDIDRTFTTPGFVPQVLGIKENACVPDVDGDIKGVMQFIAGSLIRGCGPEVYHVLGNNVYHIPNWQYLHDNYFAQRIYNVTDEVVAQYGQTMTDDTSVRGNGAKKVAGAKLYADGTLLKAKDGKIYVIINGHKMHVVSLEDLKKYAGNKMYNVSDQILNQY